MDREVVAAYTVIEPRELRNVVMADIQAAAIAHQSCDVCQAGCTARRRIAFSCGHSVCGDCISRLARGDSVTCSQCRRVATFRATDDSSHNAMLSLVKVRMSCEVETTLGDSESHAKRCLPCMSSITASLLRDSASSLATLRAKEDKVKRLSQANRRLQHLNAHLQERVDDLRETEERLNETSQVVSSLRGKVEVLYKKEDTLLAAIQDGHRREDCLNNKYVALKRRANTLLAKVQAEKQKVGKSEEKVREGEQKVKESEQKVRESERKVRESKQRVRESEEKAKHAVSMLLVKQAGDAKKNARKTTDDTETLPTAQQEEGRAKKKSRKNTPPPVSAESVEQGGGGAISGIGEGEGDGGGGGSGSGASRCERCTKRGFPCNRIVLRKNTPSCEECRSKRMGCSFNKP